MSEICQKLIIKTRERYHDIIPEKTREISGFLMFSGKLESRCSNISVVNFEQISHMVFPLLTLLNAGWEVNYKTTTW